MGARQIRSELRRDVILTLFGFRLAHYTISQIRCRIDDNAVDPIQGARVENAHERGFEISPCRRFLARNHRSASVSPVFLSQAHPEERLDFRKCLKSRQSVMIVAHPLTLTLSPQAGERGFFRLPLPLGEGWGEGAFLRIDDQSCYDFWCVPSFETFSSNLPFRKRAEATSQPHLGKRELGTRGAHLSCFGRAFL